MLFRRALSIAVFPLAAGSFAWAQPADGRLHTTERVEIPGGVLEPGNYRLRLRKEREPPKVARILNVVEILDERANRTVARVFTFRDFRLHSPAQAVTFYEAAPGRPRALSAWYPSADHGEQFVYGSSQAAEIARTASGAVFSIPADAMEMASTQGVLPAAKAPVLLWFAIAGALVFFVFRAWRAHPAVMWPDPKSDALARKLAAAAETAAHTYSQGGERRQSRKSQRR